MSKLAVKISILMTARNEEAFLADCLDSIINQEYTNWELIIIDDHSTDSTSKIMKVYTEKDARIQAFANEGKGIIEALRMAFTKSSGQMITRMDADDLMSSDKLKLFHQILRVSGPGHVTVGEVKYFSDTVLGDGYLNYEKWLNELTSAESNYNEIYKECSIPSPNWMCHRADLNACGAFNSDTYPEDYDLTFRFYQLGLKIKHVPSITHYWRDHPNRSSRNDPNYQDNRFLDLKIHYFLKLDHKADRPLALIGAGKKGKRIATLLIENSIDFEWYTNNRKKIGIDIYGKLLRDEKLLSPHSGAAYQFIVSIANPEEQTSLKRHLEKVFSEQQYESFFFC